MRRTRRRAEVVERERRAAGRRRGVHSDRRRAAAAELLGRLLQRHFALDVAPIHMQNGRQIVARRVLRAVRNARRVRRRLIQILTRLVAVSAPEVQPMELHGTAQHKCIRKQ